MLVRKFDKTQLDTEPEKVLYKDLYPWEEIEETPFGASLAIVEPQGQTMRHSHEPDETFVVFQGQGTMYVDEEETQLSQGDVVVMPSGSEHTIKNNSTTESLMFLSIFWWNDDTDTNSYHMFSDSEDANEPEISHPARLIFPSPPTSNGPLHVGHLAGPYIIADVIKRFDALKGRNNSFFLCLTDDHQSYTQAQAKEEGKAVEEVCNQYSEHIHACLRQCQAEPDKFVAPRHDENYKASVTAAFQKLHETGQILLEDIDVFHCDTCQKDLFDGHIIGSCPHCGEVSLGFACESCCLPNKTVDLEDASCTHCENTPKTRKAKRLVFQVDPLREELSNYHHNLKLSPKLRRLSYQFLDIENIRIPATAPSDWGLPVPIDGFEGQIISPWLEIGLANHYLREQVGEHKELVHCFGYDNAFCYLISDPALSLAIDKNIPLATELVVNEYLSLDDVKMSTSKGHYLSPDILLKRMPADLLRFYLALVRPESSQTSCSLRHMADTLNDLLVGRLQDWLADLGDTLSEEFNSTVPEAEFWSHEHEAFLNELVSIGQKTQRAYENRRLQIVASTSLELMSRAIDFGQEQNQLKYIPKHEDQRATGLALQLAAARLLCQILYPIMPESSAKLWKFLGHRESIEAEVWGPTVPLLSPGQRILARAGLSGRRLFPKFIDLDDMIENGEEE